MTWSVEDDVIERLTAAGVPRDNVAFARDICFILTSLQRSWLPAEVGESAVTVIKAAIRGSSQLRLSSYAGLKGQYPRGP